MPRCASCRESRPVHDFNVERARSTGCQAYCRKCARQKTREGMERLRQGPCYRRAQHAQEAVAYATDPSYRARKVARSRARHALVRGEIHRAPCRCGNPDAEMHHPDYSKPLEVVWLCKGCHRLEHHGPDLWGTSAEDPIAELLSRFDARRLRRTTPRPALEWVIGVLGRVA